MAREGGSRSSGVSGDSATTKRETGVILAETRSSGQRWQGQSPQLQSRIRPQVGLGSPTGRSRHRLVDGQLWICGTVKCLFNLDPGVSDVVQTAIRIFLQAPAQKIANALRGR